MGQKPMTLRFKLFEHRNRIIVIVHHFALRFDQRWREEGGKRNNY